MPNNTPIKASRELSERDAKNMFDDNFARGDGDPDYYGHPDQPMHPANDPQVKTATRYDWDIADLLNDRPF